MNFISEIFVLFLIITVFLNYLVSAKYRKYVLLISSIIFYAYSGIMNFFLVLVISLLTYLFGYLIDTKSNKKVLYCMGIIIILSPLIFFKYTNFLFEMVNRFLVCQLNYIDLIVPLGISFLTFQSISYISDIYYGKIKHERSITTVCTYIMFFPNVSSGPIQKARTFLPQINRQAVYDYKNIKHGLYLIAFGCLQKFCISDFLYPIVNQMISNFQDYSGFHYLFFSSCYALYIYSNFNSYSDIAIGIAELLDIKFGINFRRPYLSSSIKEFWQRWHISLNEWFVDYIYIPLGGSRNGRLKKYVNIMIVFLISGIWHGAGIHFIAWGGINAIYQIIGNITHDFRNRIYNRFDINQNTIGFRTLQKITVFILISFSWIFFAIPSFRLSLHAIKSIFMLDISTLFDGVILGLLGTNENIIFMFIVIISFAVIQIIREKKSLMTILEEESSLIRYTLYVFVTVVIFIFWSSSFQGSGNGGFVYFNF